CEREPPQKKKSPPPKREAPPRRERELSLGRQCNRALRHGEALMATPSRTRPNTLRPSATGRPGQCLKCGFRLVKTARNGWVHESGFIHCNPDVTQTCTLCGKDGLIQCSTFVCNVQGHPECVRWCTCCSKPFCPDHSGEDFLCHQCAE